MSYAAFRTPHLALAPRPKLRVNDILISRTTPPLAIPALTVSAICCRLGIASGGQASGKLLQVTRQLSQARYVGGLLLYQLTNLPDHLLGACPLMHGNAFTEFLHLMLDLIGNGVSGVACLHLFAPPPIFAGMLLGVGHHAIDLFFRQLGRPTDGDTLLLAGRFVARRDRENAVGVNVK